MVVRPLALVLMARKILSISLLGRLDANNKIAHLQESLHSSYENTQESQSQPGRFCIHLY